MLLFLPTDSVEEADGDWVKKTEKAEQAASDTEYFRLFPGFRSSGND